MKRLKKLTLISLIIVTLLSTLFGTVRVNAASTKIDKMRTLNVYENLLTYSMQLAGATAEDFNKQVKEYFCNINDSEIQEYDIISLKSLNNEEYEDKYKDNIYSWWADDKVSTDDAYGFMCLDTLFTDGTTSEYKNNESRTWNIKTELIDMTKEALEVVLNKEINDVKITCTLDGKNGKTLTASMANTDNGTEIKTFLDNPKTTGDTMDADNCKAVLTELGWNGKEDITDYDKDYYETRDSLVNNTELICTIDGEDYYFVYGYKDDEVDEDGYYKVNLCLISKRTKEEIKEFATTLGYDAYVDDKDVGGTTDNNGTFWPSYDDTNDETAKKDADVTATIKSTTSGVDITAVNGVALTDDGKANSEGWYYPDTNDKETIAKIYPFDDYDNSTDNGTVSEKVTVTGSNGGTSEQNVSIQWPFRIIDKTYDPETPDENTTETTVTVETNLPMDPDKLPSGWEIVPGTDNHKASRTFKKGETVDGTLTFTQNGTGAQAKTNIEYKWPESENKATTVLPKTGEKVGILLIVISVATSVILYKRKKGLIKK